MRWRPARPALAAWALAAWALAVWAPTAVPPAAAADGCPTIPGSCTAFAFVLENDLVSGRDRYYTNGFLFAFRSEAYGPEAWAGRLAGLPAWLVPAGKLRWGVSLGQNIYTPEDTAARIPDPRDRPYAGWLYGAVTLTSSTDRQLSSVELQLGVVGPSALAEQAQNNTHQLLNVAVSNGWEGQLRDEPGANLVLTRQLRLNWPTGIPDLSIGVVPTAAASAGNVLSYGAVGGLLRIGSELSADFGPPRVRPVSAGTVFFEPRDSFGWYAFAGVEGRAVLRDISLDGNTWRGGPSVDRETLVGDVSAGLVVMLAAARLTASYTIRSREFEGHREASHFGSFSIAFRF